MVLPYTTYSLFLSRFAPFASPRLAPLRTALPCPAPSLPAPLRCAPARPVSPRPYRRAHPRFYSAPYHAYFYYTITLLLSWTPTKAERHERQSKAVKTVSVSVFVLYAVAMAGKY
jgi:hypothetical protein